MLRSGADHRLSSRQSEGVVSSDLLQSVNLFCIGRTQGPRHIDSSYDSGRHTADHYARGDIAGDYCSSGDHGPLTHRERFSGGSSDDGTGANPDIAADHYPTGPAIVGDEGAAQCDLRAVHDLDHLGVLVFEVDLVADKDAATDFYAAQPVDGRPDRHSARAELGGQMEDAVDGATDDRFFHSSFPLLGGAKKLVNSRIVPNTQTRIRREFRPL